MPTPRPRDAHDLWGPLIRLVNGLTGLVALVAVAAVPLVAFAGWSFLTIGEDEICAVGSMTVGFVDDSTSTPGLQDDAGVRSDQATLCRPHDGWQDQTLSALTVLPGVVVFVVFLVMAGRVMRRTDVDRPFSPQLGRGLIAMSRWLVIGIPVAAAVQWWANSRLYESMLDPTTGLRGQPEHYHLSLAAMFGAVAMFSLGRVLLRAAELQDDLEGTV